MAGDADFQYGMVADGVIALLHSDKPPSDEAWVAHHDLLEQAMGTDERFVEAGYFVVTAGGAPNARQRRVGNQRVRGRRMNRCVVTDSFVVRKLIKSWSWFAPGLRAFAPHELREALLAVGTPPADVEQVYEKIRALNAQLARPVPWLPTALPPRSSAGS